MMFESFSVSIASLIFAKLLFVVFIYVRRMILGQEISHSKFSKTVPLDIVSTNVYLEVNLQRIQQKSKESLMFEPFSAIVVYLIFAALLFVGFVSVRNFLLGQEIANSNISKTVSFFI